MLAGMDPVVRRTRIKICGITRAADAKVAVAAGVDALGLVFHPPSSRAVSIAQAEHLRSFCPAMVSVVALFVDPDPVFVDEVVKTVRPQILQYHGGENREACERSGLPYMKALRVAAGTDVGQLAQGYASAAALLLDTYVEGVYGGTGQRFDWSLIPDNLQQPLVLAGGLTAGNVESAVVTAKPYAVDVSGGVESVPGEKEKHKIFEFVRAVRVADESLMSGIEVE